MYRVAAVTTVLGMLAVGPALAAGNGPGNGGGGGGGETETAGNNLSYPVLWTEEDTTYRLALSGAMLAPAVATASTCIATDATYPDETSYNQQQETNLWQAENAYVAGTKVTTVDWGDALESTDLNPQKQRVEVSLYSKLVEPMTGYAMCKTNNVTGVGEMWGAVAGSGDDQSTSLTTLEFTDAQVYTAGARLTIQRIVPDLAAGYTWDATAHTWVGCGADAPVVNQAVYEATDGPDSFGVEVTVGGKITYGYVLSTGTLPKGEYRLTFSLDGPSGTFPGTGTTLADATIAIPVEEATASVTAAAAEGESGGAPGANTAVMRGDLNLTYIDVGLKTRTDPVPTCTPTGGGGTTGGGGGTAAAPATPPDATPAGPQPEAGNPNAGPQAATALIAQKAKIAAKKSGRYLVGKVIVLAKRPIKTDAGVTVRWRATTASQDNCLVKVRKGKATATLVKPGRCTVIGWAPAPSPAFAPFKVTRTYRVIR